MPRRLSPPRSQSSELADAARQGVLRVRLPVRAPAHDLQLHRQSRYGAHPLQRLGLLRAARGPLVAAALREAGHSRLGLR